MKTIITHPQFEYLNNDLCDNNSILDYSFNIFADWWPNIFLNDVKNKIEHKEITYIWDFSKREDFFQNYSLIRWICDYYADKLQLNILLIFYQLSLAEENLKLQYIFLIFIIWVKDFFSIQIN